MNRAVKWCLVLCISLASIFTQAETGVVVKKSSICFAIEAPPGYLIVSGQIYVPVGASVIGDFSGTLIGPIKILDTNGQSVVGFTFIHSWVYSKDELSQKWKYFNC